MTGPWDKRRMTIGKFSNRPPFDRKKSRDREDVAEKIRRYPEEYCRNCCKNRAQSPVKEKRFMSKSLTFEASTQESADELRPGGTSTIPKVLEQFRRIHISDPTMNQYVSVQTLYRNTEARKLGKNIPEHKLMKSLLANWNCDAPREGFPDSGTPKYKKSKRVLGGDEVIRCDVWQTGIRRTSDKKTSTTGLLWRPRTREVLRHPSGDWVDRQSIPPCGCRAGLNATKEGLKNASEDFLEKVATKVAPSKRSREKTFVQSQVEKLDKARKSPVVARATNKQEPKHEANNCYIGMMNKIRHNCPQFQSFSTNLQPGLESANSWSDPSETVLIPREITFPKETKTAVNQRLSEQNRSKILSFNVKGNKACRPCRAPNNPQIGKGDQCNDGDVRRNVQLQGLTEKNRPLKIKLRSKFNIPCRRNLLCDKGDQHLGSCGAHSNNKAVY